MRLYTHHTKLPLLRYTYSCLYASTWCSLPSHCVSPTSPHPPPLASPPPIYLQTLIEPKYSLPVFAKGRSHLQSSIGPLDNGDKSQANTTFYDQMIEMHTKLTRLTQRNESRKNIQLFSLQIFSQSMTHLTYTLQINTL